MGVGRGHQWVLVEGISGGRHIMKKKSTVLPSHCTNC